MHVGMSQLRYERNELDAATQHLQLSRDLGEHAGLPQNRYRWRVAHGADPAGGRRSGRRARPARRGGAPVRGRLLPERPTGPGVAGAGVGRPGALGRGAGLGAGARSLRRGRAQLPARVRAPHPRPGAAGPVRGGPRRGVARRRRPTPGAPPASGGGGEADREPARDPGAAVPRPPGARRPPGRAGLAAAGADAGRAGGLRPDLRGRGPADGLPAARRPRSRASAGAMSVGSWPLHHDRERQPARPTRA